MRALADADRIRELMRALGREGREEATVYLAGGATAVLHGWRPATIDVDLKLVPERETLLRGLARLKDELQVNVELAAPGDFIPLPSGWEDRSPLIAREGPLSFRHFDLYSQALAKIERGHARDIEDLRAMMSAGLVDPARVRTYFDEIEPELYRFPAIDAPAFRAAVVRLSGDGSGAA